MGAARTYAGAGAAVMIAIVAGQVLLDETWPPSFTPEEALLFALFPIGVTIGLAIGSIWRPRLGGWVATLSLVGFYAGVLALRGELPRGPYFLLFSGGGPLLLLADWPASRGA